MKKVTLLIFLLVSFLSKAQNYQPFNSKSLQTFFQIEPYYYDFSNDARQNMWGTKIDSTELSVNSDSVYYNYKIVRDTAFVGDIYDERCIWISAPNWSGKKTIISTSGDSWFYNEVEDSILIKHSALPDSSWVVYTYEDGSILSATVENIIWADDIWIQDSVKRISFEHLDLFGNNVSDIINGKEIELYQNHGFRKAFDFLKFPFDTTTLYRVDINCINQLSPYFEYPQVGDIESFYYSCQDVNPGWPTSYWSESNSKKVLEVIPIQNSDSLQVKYLKNSRNSNGFYSYEDYEIVYVVPTDFFKSIYSFDDFWINDSLYESISFLPRENAAGFEYITNGNGLSCVYPQVRTNSCVILIFDHDVTQTDSCYLAPDPGKCLTGSNSGFTAYIGQSYSWWGSGDWASPPVYYCEGGLTYIKKGGFECGNYWFVGIEDYEQLAAEINIYPNPASNTITIQSPPNYQFSLVRILNAFGQEVYQSTPNQQSTFDISLFSSGIYFISLSNGEQTVTKKFVKE